ncbi:MAG: hypothetical protein HY890_06920 [Deltaproteobacteria bacterium]|nr:hypothetical protein [Deltaproteobacteria bacterium]
MVNIAAEVRAANTARKLLVIFIFIAAAVHLCAAGALGAERWKSRATRYSTIYYPFDDVLLEFGAKIGGNPFLKRDLDAAFKSIGEDVDRITLRVETLLDMYPPDLRFSIYIYRTYAEIKYVYREMGFSGDAPIAFYLYRARSIYLSFDGLSDRVLAHEMAHAVINLYYTTAPPAEMQEVLAQYVDKHLWDELTRKVR